MSTPDNTDPDALLTRRAMAIHRQSRDFATQQLEKLTPEQPEAYWNAVDRMAAAKDTLSLLESADMAQLLKMCAEDS